MLLSRISLLVAFSELRVRTNQFLLEVVITTNESVTFHCTSDFLSTPAVVTTQKAKELKAIQLDSKQWVEFTLELSLPKENPKILQKKDDLSRLTRGQRGRDEGSQDLTSQTIAF